MRVRVGADAIRGRRLEVTAVGWTITTVMLAAEVAMGIALVRKGGAK